MDRQEILHTDYNELVDLISCLAVYNGTARLARKKLSFDEVLRLT